KGIRILNDRVNEEFEFLCTDLSADGSVIVGYQYFPDETTAAAFWNERAGIKTLGRPKNSNFDPESFQSKAMSVSGDGNTIAGFMFDKNHSQAFIWDEANGVQDLGDLPGGEDSSLARGISANGSTVVGAGFNDENINEAFIWDRDNGIRGLGSLRGGSRISYANSVSGDGSIVVGRASSYGYNDAFIWGQQNGMRRLKLVLENKYKLDLTGWLLADATSISDDGLTIVGWGGNPQGELEAWIVKLDP
ncbi:MAG: PEP-CTERM sorting domain-containing protein, partial [Cyanobacteria bacterium J06558_2]